ncbi:MAG: hypothetical protein K2H85_01095, partial [Allobaculum sp.]|nr:hypothetical protein [Allobaculum sp.]
EVLTESYGRFYIEDCFSASPWTGLLWNILLGYEFDRDKQPVNLLYPKNASSYLSTVENAMTNENLISPIKESDSIFPETKRHAFTPTALFIILLSVALLLIVPTLKGRLRTVCRIFDGLLLLSTSAVGCVLWYMFFASLAHPPVYLNVLLLIFNPAPIILLLLHSEKYWKVYTRILTIICIILIIGIPFFPQLRHYGLWIFLLAILTRSIILIMDNGKQKDLSIE